MKPRMNTNRHESFTPLQRPNPGGAYFLRARAVIFMLKQPEGRAPLLPSCSFVSIRG
jgi:hypothetical protein